MAFRFELRRAALLAALFAAFLLLILFGIDAAVSIPVRSTLSKFDSSCSFEGLRFAPGTIILKDLNFPERGLSLRNCVVYWSGSPLDPVVDSLLLEGGRWSLIERPAEDASLSETGSGYPRFRFSDIDIISGTDTLTVSGRYGNVGSDETVSLQLTGNCGMASGTAFLGGSRDSLYLDWFCLNRVPKGMVDLPEPLIGLRFQGSMEAVRDENLHVTGLVTSVNGDPAEVDFEIDDSSGYASLKISADLTSVREVLISRAEELFGAQYVDLSPGGRFSLRFMNSDTIGVEVLADLDSLEIYSPRLSEDTVRTDVAIRCIGRVNPDNWSVEVDSGKAVFNDVPVYFALNGEFRDDPRFSLRLWNDSVSGERLAASVPGELMGRLEGLELSGTASFDILLEMDWGCPDSSDFQARVDVFGLRVAYSPISVGQLRYGGSCRMEDSWGNTRMIELDTLENDDFVQFDSLHPSFEGLLRCAEDATFRYHRGFCIYHIRNSIIANIQSGRFSRGGSTLTMQLARNLFLGREKTLARKVQEVFLTWRLESYLSKDRMLEIYANIVELGPDVFGFQEAALYYFSRDFKDLSTRQVAYLVSILPGPRLYYRFYRNGSVPDYWESYLDRLLRISDNRGWITPNSAASALSDTIRFNPLQEAL